MRVVVALGGNALGDAGTAGEMRATLDATSRSLADLVESGAQPVLTHGNGPQVGRILLQQEYAAEHVPPMPMDVCGAQSQGQIGYLLAQSLDSELRRRGGPTRGSVLCLITQTLVDGRDPAFRRPTKPVGPSYDRPTAQAIAHRTGYVFQIMPDRRWRRVVASPRPLGFVEEPILRAVVDAGHIVIAAGGGGVPVVAHGPTLRGVEAVVDKDLAAARLAVIVGADVLLILTAVSRVQIGYGTAEAQEVEDLTVAAASDYLQQGQFPAGSMGPKVQACIDFARTGGKSIIAALTDAGAALAGTAGTRIHA